MDRFEQIASATLQLEILGNHLLWKEKQSYDITTDWQQNT